MGFHGIYTGARDEKANLDVPRGQALDIPDLHLQARKVERGHGVEGDVEEDEGPLEEGVDGVCWGQMSVSQQALS